MADLSTGVRISGAVRSPVIKSSPLGEAGRILSCTKASPIAGKLGTPPFLAQVGMALRRISIHRRQRCVGGEH